MTFTFTKMQGLGNDFVVIDATKKHFEFMLYPGGRHGWGGPQQSHSSNENNMFIYKNLLQKTMPEILVR